MIMEVNHNERVRQKVEAYANDKKENDLHFHPLMLVTKNDKKKPVKYLLYYNSVIITAPNFSANLKALMQLFFVMGFKYPSESQHVCAFLATYFFGIKLDEKLPDSLNIQRLMELLQK